MKSKQTLGIIAAIIGVITVLVAPIVWGDSYQVPPDVKFEKAGPLTSDFDVCDVSFLIPPGDRPIYVSKGGMGGPILPKELFDKLPGLFREKGHPHIEKVYEKLVVTGFRFDPAGPIDLGATDLESTRLPNIRVIAQVLHEGRLTDSAVHMVFALGVKVSQADIPRGVSLNLDPQPRQDLIEDMKRFKQGNAARGIFTAGVPLGVHPGLFKEVPKESRNAFLDQFEQILWKHAHEQNYFATAVMVTVNPAALAKPAELEGKERWEWAKAAVLRTPGKEGRLKVDLVPESIPSTTVSPSPFSQSLTADKDKRSGVILSAESSFHFEARLDINNVTKLLREREEGDTGADEGGVNAADLLENSRKLRIATQECVLCHVATPAREYALGKKSGAFTRKELFAIPGAKGITSRLPPEIETRASEGGYRVMNFAFFKGAPSVSLRTVNESLEAAWLINKWQASKK